MLSLRGVGVLSRQRRSSASRGRSHPWRVPGRPASPRTRRCFRGRPMAACRTARSCCAAVSRDERVARVITFESLATDIVAGTRGGVANVFVVKRRPPWTTTGSPWRTGKTSLLSHGIAGRACTAVAARSNLEIVKRLAGHADIRTSPATSTSPTPAPAPRSPTPSTLAPSTTAGAKTRATATGSAPAGRRRRRRLARRGAPWRHRGVNVARAARRDFARVPVARLSAAR